MKRVCLLCFCVFLVFSLSVSAMAATEATRLESQAAVGEDGSCSVTLTIQLHLDATVTELTFPLPADAEDVLLGGSFVTTQALQDRVLVQLPNLTAGDYTFTLTYRLPQVVSRETEGAQVMIPLLSGFAYPVSYLECAVTLPGPIETAPVFISGYYQEDIASVISAEVTGNTLKAAVEMPLKDHETLVLMIPVEAEYFPLVENLEPLMDTWDAIVLSCAALAVVYYLLSLRPQVHRRSRCFSPPDGISAGEVGTCLTGTGMDLTLMVFSWAQMGYLQIEVQGRHRVILHKKMEMGNERSQEEIHAFQTLFSKRSFLDGSGVHYARLYRKMALQAPLTRQLFKPNSGKPMIFRLLSCAAGCFSGVKLALALTEHPVGQVMLTILVCLLCGIFSYVIQAGGKCLPLRNKLPMVLGLVCVGVWIGLGVLSQSLSVALPMVIFQMLCGVALAFGGRRSELGKRSLAQVWGLRHYMVRGNNFELQQRMQANSNYFYELAPYALAMGVDKRFARRFGKTKLPECGFLITRQTPPETASQWAALLRQVADTLNARQRKLPYERITQRK